MLSEAHKPAEAQHTLPCWDCCKGAAAIAISPSPRWSRLGCLFPGVVYGSHTCPAIALHCAHWPLAYGLSTEPGVRASIPPTLLPSFQPQLYSSPSSRMEAAEATADDVTPPQQLQHRGRIAQLCCKMQCPAGSTLAARATTPQALHYKLWRREKNLRVKVQKDDEEEVRCKGPQTHTRSFSFTSSKSLAYKKTLTPPNPAHCACTPGCTFPHPPPSM